MPASPEKAKPSRRRRQQPVETFVDPVESAKAAGLRYVSDTRPGISRKRWRSGFRYTIPDGAPLRDAETLARIKSLVIPPAWIDVWICPKVLATIVRLMETTFIRVGNVEYARENQSYGLTTMRRKHVDIDGSTIRFTFQGKSRVHHTIDVEDRQLARIVKRCRDIPGHELFQYIDRDGERHTVDSSDVNDYLREITSEHFTAKDFRTWAGTVMACMMLREFEPFESETQAKKNVLRAIEAVAKRLGNTPSVCRKCYVHPAVLESYLGGSMLESIEHRVQREMDEHSEALRHEEHALLHLLEQRLNPREVLQAV